MKSNMDEFEYLFNSIKPYAQNLSKKETMRLIKQAQEGNEAARNKIIMHNMRLIISIAKRFYTNGGSLSDLVMVGIEGIITALKKFDFSLDTKFSTYASIWIRHKIIRFCKENNSIIRIPIWAQDDKSNKNDIKVCSIEDLLNGRSGSRSDKNNSKMKFNEPAASDNHHDIMLKEKLLEMLDTIDLRSKCIICHYFGIDEEQKILEEIGSLYNLTRERIRQIIKTSLTHFKYSETFKKQFAGEIIKNKNSGIINKKFSIGSIAHDSKEGRSPYTQTSMFIERDIYDKLKSFHKSKGIGSAINKLVEQFLQTSNENCEKLCILQRISDESNRLERISLWLGNKESCKKNFDTTNYNRIKTICHENGFYVGYILGALVKQYVCSKIEQEK